jgi:hypothetical protein
VRWEAKNWGISVKKNLCFKKPAFKPACQIACANPAKTTWLFIYRDVFADYIQNIKPLPCSLLVVWEHLPTGHCPWVSSCQSYSDGLPGASVFLRPLRRHSSSPPRHIAAVNRHIFTLAWMQFMSLNFYLCWFRIIFTMSWKYKGAALISIVHINLSFVKQQAAHVYIVPWL